MEIGIGLPTVIPTDQGGVLLEWAKRADRAGFSSLSVLDRLVYDNLDPVITLTAAAAVTTRIRLVTAILITPMRSTGILAKELASLDVLSDGRLTLGVGVGGRRDDFDATDSDHSTRGKRFDAQLESLKRIWAGLEPVVGIGPIGPLPVQPGGPPLFFGGRSQVALDRVGKWGIGYVTGSLTDVTGAKSTYDLCLPAWKDWNRPGYPLFMGSLACAIGVEEAGATDAALQRYYSYQGGRPANQPGLPGRSFTANQTRSPSDGPAIKEILKRCEQVGMDEVFVRPAGVMDPDQVDRLAEALL